MSGCYGPWNQKRVSLRYMLGELRLFSAPFPGVQLNVPFSKLSTPDDADCLEPPPDILTRSVEVARIPACPVPHYLPRLLLTSKWIRYIPYQYRRFHIEIAGSFADYLRKFSSKTRKNLARQARRLEQLSERAAMWRCFSKPSEMEEFYGLARKVSRKTYQENLLKAGLPSNTSFLERLKRQAANDAIRGYLLFVREEPVAYMFCRAADDTLVDDYVGFDPAFREWSPGTVLLYLVLERLFVEQRFQWFDFEIGEGWYKEFFSTGNRLSADIYYFRRTNRNFGLVLAHMSLAAASRTIVRSMAQIGAANRLRKSMRSWKTAGEPQRRASSAAEESVPDRDEDAVAAGALRKSAE